MSISPGGQGVQMSESAGRRQKQEDERRSDREARMAQGAALEAHLGVHGACAFSRGSIAT